MKLGFGLARETSTMTMTKRISKSTLEVFMVFALVCFLFFVWVGGEEGLFVGGAIMGLIYIGLQRSTYIPSL